MVERETYLVRDFGLICVTTRTTHLVELGLSEGNWLIWAGFLKGIERLGQKADREFA